MSTTQTMAWEKTSRPGVMQARRGNTRWLMEYRPGSHTWLLRLADVPDAGVSLSGRWAAAREDATAIVCGDRRPLPTGRPRLHWSDVDGDGQRWETWHNAVCWVLIRRRTRRRYVWFLHRAEGGTALDHPRWTHTDRTMACRVAELIILDGWAADGDVSGTPVMAREVPARVEGGVRYLGYQERRTLRDLLIEQEAGRER